MSVRGWWCECEVMVVWCEGRWCDRHSGVGVR